MFETTEGFALWFTSATYGSTWVWMCEDLHIRFAGKGIRMVKEATFTLARRRAFVRVGLLVPSVL